MKLLGDFSSTTLAEIGDYSIYLSLEYLEEELPFIDLWLRVLDRRS